MIEMSGFTLFLIVLVNFASGMVLANQLHLIALRKRREQYAHRAQRWEDVKAGYAQNHNQEPPK